MSKDVLRGFLNHRERLLITECVLKAKQGHLCHENMKAILIPRLRDVLFFIIFVTAIMLGPRMLNQDGDLPRHLLMGKIILQNASVPTTDIFSHAYYGHPIVIHEWLAGIIFHLFYSIMGLNGVVLLAAVLLSLTFSSIYTKTAESSGSRFSAFILVTWGAAITSLHWITRPHLFTMLFLALFLSMVDKISIGRSKNIWVLPLLMLIWGNVHGEFIAGFLVLFAYGAGWLWDVLIKKDKIHKNAGKYLGAIFLLSLLTTLMNPFGVKTWSTVTGYVQNEYLMSRINETVPPNFAQPRFIILLSFLVFSILLLALNKGRLSTGRAFALAGFSAMSLLSARNVHLYGVAAPFLLAQALTGIKDVPLIAHTEKIFHEVENNLKGHLWPILTVLIIGTLLLAGVTGIRNEFSPLVFPVEAATWLQENPQDGNMLNAFDWGGYLLFRLWPEQLTFIDSQTDVIGNISRDYEQMVTLRNGWQATLARYNVTWAIIPYEWPLTITLVDSGWQIIYRDPNATILRK